MRTAIAVALCFILGACATFGWGDPHIYGIYDLVPETEVVSGWFELKTDGTWDMSFANPSQPERGLFSGVYSTTEERDGCVWIQCWAEERPAEKTPIRICNEVLVVLSSYTTFHKRR